MPRATDILAAWAQQQTMRDHAMLRLSIAMLMRRLNVTELTLSPEEIEQAATSGTINAQIREDQTIQFSLVPRH
jgi:hypothetical protein